MTTWIFLTFTLLASSFYPAEAGPKRSGNPSQEEKPTPEELGCKDGEVVQEALGEVVVKIVAGEEVREVGYECATHPRYRKPLFECSRDRDCVRACEKHDYPEACKEMTHCDEPRDEHSSGGICNDLMKCEDIEDCEDIGDLHYAGLASLDCESRDKKYGKRCYYRGGTVMA